MMKLMMITKTKKENHQKQRNIVEEDSDSVTAVLMGVENVQNLETVETLVEDLMWIEKNANW